MIMALSFWFKTVCSENHSKSSHSVKNIAVLPLLTAIRAGAKVTGLMAQTPAERSIRPRLETQIHRRKKAKAFSPLLPEWEKSEEVAPVHLRMDAALMAPAARRLKSGQGRTSGSSM
jgi:hypothetical protein